MPPDIEGIASAVRDKLAGRERLVFTPADVSTELEARAAAVLIPVIARPTGPSILFVERTDRVSTHKGQVAFPGGGVEPGETSVQAALREAHEEVSLPPDDVEVVGELDDMLSITSYIVTPVVGIVRRPPSEYVRQEFEVAKVFETPIAHLLDKEHFRVERFRWDQVPEGTPIEALRKIRIESVGWDPTAEDYPMFFFDTPDGTVWGLTAVILKQFLTLSFGF